MFLLTPLFIASFVLQLNPDVVSARYSCFINTILSFIGSVDWTNQTWKRNVRLSKKGYEDLADSYLSSLTLLLISNLTSELCLHQFLGTCLPLLQLPTLKVDVCQGVYKTSLALENDLKTRKHQLWSVWKSAEKNTTLIRYHSLVGA